MRLPLALTATLLTVSFVALPGSAQTVASGEVRGQVTGPDGIGIANVVVTVRSHVMDMARESSTDLQGVYSVPFLQPGSYEVRVEAFGYRPVVFPDLRIEAGGPLRLDVSVTPAAPPVTQVDTVLTAGLALTRWQGPGPRISGNDLDMHRSLLGGWTALSRFSSVLDPFLGSQGLPGMMTAEVVDGVPFFPARQPYLRGEDVQSPAFPAALLGRASVLQDPADVYWLGNAGTTLAADTRTGMAGGAGGVEGSWSGAPLWSSSTLNIADKPTLASYHAAANAGVTLVPDTSRLFLAAEGLRQQSPTNARMPADLQGDLQGVDPSILQELASPSVETISRISGLARLDRWTGTSRFMLRASGGHLTRSYDALGPGRMGYGIGLPEKATDLSAAVSLNSVVSTSMTMEFLGGLSYSDRTYGDSTALPATALVGLGLPVGVAPGSSAQVSRLDAFVAPALHLDFGPGTGKGGLDLRTTNHSYNQAWAGDGDLFFADGAGLVTGDGVYTSGTSKKTTFTSSRFGAFAQYEWDAAPGLRVTIGGRLDREILPRSDVKLDTAWAAASGVSNNAFKSRVVEPGGVVSATWDPRGDGHTIVFGAASLSSGTMDPALLHEVIAQDGDAALSRYVGSGIDWPSVGSGPAGTQSATILTLLGPSTRAPRTTEVGGGVVEDLGAGWSAHVSAAARRTDFLPRRRDVNLPIYPIATDAHGRDVFGDLQKVGTVVAADPGSNRRFQGFDAVWAIDPDGWSKYQGVSVGLEYTRKSTDAWVSYTRSRTTDNWVGAAKGLPDAALDPQLPAQAGAAPWAEGTSDFDTPNRLVAGARVHLDVGRGTDVSASYTYQSGLPFTPGYRVGVDANGDGSARNDVAFVPQLSDLGSLAGAWSCLADQAGSFAARNSCRAPSSSTLNAGVRIGLTSLGTRTLYLTVEGFNLIEDKSGVVDSALLLVDPNQPITSTTSGTATTVSVPVTVNPDFGKVVLPATRGRILRVGVRIGG